mmetsp:Transcript_124924/g.266625  ORF Transcript_124924/g.266625 Transcript_124924/m.266625 type:complete len:232 (+) Transcript_124924:3254-3949(+)
MPACKSFLRPSSKSSWPVTFASSWRALSSEARTSRSSTCKRSVPLANSSRTAWSCSRNTASRVGMTAGPGDPGGTGAAVAALLCRCARSASSRSWVKRSTVSASAFICSAFSAKCPFHCSTCWSCSSCMAWSSLCAAVPHSSVSFATDLRSVSFCSARSCTVRNARRSASMTSSSEAPGGQAGKAPVSLRFSCTSTASCLATSRAWVSKICSDRSALFARFSAAFWEASRS